MNKNEELQKVFEPLLKNIEKVNKKEEGYKHLYLANGYIRKDNYVLPDEVFEDKDYETKVKQTYDAVKNLFKRYNNIKLREEPFIWKSPIDNAEIVGLLLLVK